MTEISLAIKLIYRTLLKKCNRCKTNFKKHNTHPPGRYNIFFEVQALTSIIGLIKILAIKAYHSTDQLMIKYAVN